MCFVKADDPRALTYNRKVLFYRNCLKNIQCTIQFPIDYLIKTNLPIAGLHEKGSQQQLAANTSDSTCKGKQKNGMRHSGNDRGREP